MWRALKDRPSAFAQYLSLFRASTFRRVVKEALSPEIIGSMLRALNRDFTPSSVSRLATLHGLSESPSFGFTLSLLPEEDIRSVQTVFRQLQEDLAQGEQSEGYEQQRERERAQLEALRRSYGEAL